MSNLRKCFGAKRYLFKSGLGAVARNIVPSQSGVYDIGSSALPWKDIYYSGRIYGQYASIGTATTTTASSYINSTAAADGAQQYSPLYSLGGGSGWKSNATAASQTLRFASQIRPVQGAAQISGAMHWMVSLNGAGWNSVANMRYDGVMTAGGFCTTTYGKYYLADPGNTIGWIAYNGGDLRGVEANSYSGRTWTFTSDRTMASGENIFEVRAPSAQTTGNLQVWSTGSIGSPSVKAAINWIGLPGFYAVSPRTAQPPCGEDFTNDVPSGGTANQTDNYTDLTTYANDAAAIRNNLY